MKRGPLYWLGVWVRTLRPVPGYPDSRYKPPAPQYRYVWWLLDPTHTNHCEDCRRRAARSPYVAPGSGGNELLETPGDGNTQCSADCTCILSYSPPSRDNSEWRDVPMTPLRYLLRYYTHGQIWYLQCAENGTLWQRITGTTDRRHWPRNVPEMSVEEYDASAPPNRWRGWPRNF